MTAALEQDFATSIRAALDECHRRGYHPTAFESMLDNANATSVAQKLVVSGDLQSGLKRLAQMNCLNLSVEAIMLEPRFATLFEQPILEAARWRLAAVN